MIARVAPMTTLLTLGIGLLLFVLFGRMPGDGRWASVLGNAAHAPVFGCFALVAIGLQRQLRPRTEPAREYLVAFAVSLAAGGLIELMQSALGRDASLNDLLRDALGTLTAIALFAAIDPSLRGLAAGRAVRRAGIALGAAGTVLILVPPVTTLWAYAGRDRNFPLLVDFSSPVSTYFMATYSNVSIERQRIPADLAGNADRAIGLRARVSIRERWAIALWEPSPDWRRYKWLAIDVANPTADTLILGVRIRDYDQHGTRPPVDLGTIKLPPRSRATQRLALRPQATVHGVGVDYSAIRGMVLRADPASQAQEFYVMRIWLGV